MSLEGGTYGGFPIKFLVQVVSKYSHKILKMFKLNWHFKLLESYMKLIYNYRFNWNLNLIDIYATQSRSYYMSKEKPTKVMDVYTVNVFNFMGVNFHDSQKKILFYGHLNLSVSH